MSDDHQELIQEVKKIAKFADMQRKITKYSLIALVVLIPILIVSFLIVENYFEKSIKGIDEPNLEDISWYDIDRYLRRGDVSNAIEVGEKMIQKTPSYWIGHRKLGHLYLTAGKLNKSLQHFEEAYRLFPSEANEENLKAIKKRIEMGNP